jgi:transcriptional regulator with XRE-family HTH domain
MLGQKLRAIRKYLDLTQPEMVERLATKQTPIYPGHISEYERGVREPPLLVLLRYARMVQVTMDVLVDDDLELPSHVKPVVVSVVGRRIGNE